MFHLMIFAVMPLFTLNEPSLFDLYDIDISSELLGLLEENLLSFEIYNSLSNASNIMSYYSKNSSKAHAFKETAITKTSAAKPLSEVSNSAKSIPTSLALGISSFSAYDVHNLRYSFLTWLRDLINRSFSFGFLYLRGFVVILFIDACLTDDEPL